jgi:hypothetical protein
MSVAFKRDDGMYTKSWFKRFSGEGVALGGEEWEKDVLSSTSFDLVDGGRLGRCDDKSTAGVGTKVTLEAWGKSLKV